MESSEAKELAEERVRLLIDKGYIDPLRFDEAVKKMMKTLIDDETT
jgi:hypothetical protein